MRPEDTRRVVPRGDAFNAPGDGSPTKRRLPMWLLWVMAFSHAAMLVLTCAISLLVGVYAIPYSLGLQGLRFGVVATVSFFALLKLASILVPKVTHALHLERLASAGCELAHARAESAVSRCIAKAVATRDPTHLKKAAARLRDLRRHGAPGAQGAADLLAGVERVEVALRQSTD